MPSPTGSNQQDHFKKYFLQRILSNFFGNVLVVRAARDLKAGEEVFNCYGPHFRRMPRSERQQVLMDQYNFRCCCGPCSMPFDLMEMYSAFKCPACSGPLVPEKSYGICRNCGLQNNITPEMVAKRDEASAILQQAKEDPSIALVTLVKAWRIARATLHHSHDVTIQLADELARHLASRGEWCRSLRVQKACLVYVRARYGDPSPVTVSEIAKLGQTAEAAAHELSELGQHSQAQSYLEESNSYIQEAKNQSLILYGTPDLIDDIDL